MQCLVGFCRAGGPRTLHLHPLLTPAPALEGPWSLAGRLRGSRLARRCLLHTAHGVTSPMPAALSSECLGKEMEVGADLPTCRQEGRAGSIPIPTGLSLQQTGLERMKSRRRSPVGGQAERTLNLAWTESKVAPVPSDSWGQGAGVVTPSTQVLLPGLL